MKKVVEGSLLEELQGRVVVCVSGGNAKAELVQELLVSNKTSSQTKRCFEVCTYVLCSSPKYSTFLSARRRPSTVADDDEAVRAQVCHNALSTRMHSYILTAESDSTGTVSYPTRHSS